MSLHGGIMSKHLVKILSVCALVVLLMVSVVGAAIGVTEAVGCTLTIADASRESEAEKENENVNHKVVVKVNGKVQDKNVLQIGKYSEVTLEYQATGYEFKGWYVGNYNVETDKAVETKITYTFDIKGDTKISAVADLKKFTVNYSGKGADGVTDINFPTQTVEYGEKLERPASNTEDLYFLGWKIKGAEGELAGKKYYYATFDDVENEANIVLEAAWGAQEYVTYTVNVAFNKLQPNNIKTIEYNTKTGFTSYMGQVEREGYELAGIEFNGKVYNYDKSNDTFIGLGNAIAAGEETTVDAVAVWKSLYRGHTFTFAAVKPEYVEEAGGMVDLSVTALRNGQRIVVEQTIENVTFEDTEAEDTFDLNAEVLDVYNSLGYSDFEDENGNKVTFKNEVKLAVGNTGFIMEESRGIGEGFTFKYLLDFLQGSHGQDITTHLDIVITFIYE